MWNQISAVTALNLRSVPQRLGASAVTVLGIAGVVVVFVGVLSMAQGFRQAMTTGGDSRTAIVLRSGASSEMGSMLGLETVRLVKDAPGIARQDGRAQASAEFAVVVRHVQAGTGRVRNITLRGVEPAAFSIRDEIRVIDGRRFQPGRHEVIVGRAAARELGDQATGRSSVWGGSTWDVVGVFEGDGGSVESEVWCEIDMLQQAFRRQNAFQAVYARLESPESLDVLRRAACSSGSSWGPARSSRRSTRCTRPWCRARARSPPCARSGSEVPRSSALCWPKLLRWHLQEARLAP